MQGRTPQRVVVTKVRSGKRTRVALYQGTALFLVVVFATIILHGNWRVALLIVSGGIGLWYLTEDIQRYRQRLSILQDVDTMDNAEFRRYVSELLRAQGYIVHQADRPADQRVDFLLMRGGETIACRLQRQSRRVGREAIAKAVAGARAHGCKRAMVITNHLFTFLASRMARQTNCVLIDRETLAGLVSQYRQGHRVLAFHREETTGLRKRR
jgi:HJR/Mrr/RecB family endonuclease